MQRVNLVRSLKAQGLTAYMMLPRVNELHREHDIPEITIDTVYEDFGRVKELQAQEYAVSRALDEDIREKRITQLDEVYRTAMDGYHTTAGSSLNRSGYLSTARAAIDSVAKLQGLVAAKIDLSLLSNAQADRIVSIFEDVICHPDARLDREQRDTFRRLTAERLMVEEEERRRSDGSSA